jgi:hypothetical protein
MEVTYPTIETFDRADVPPGTFDPELPTNEPEFINETINMSSEQAALFAEYPIWSSTVPGFALNAIRQERFTFATEPTSDSDYVWIILTPTSGDPANAIRIASEAPLSDHDWFARDASHQREFEEFEFHGNRAWRSLSAQEGRATIEIAFPDAYVTLTAPTEEQAEFALNNLVQLNADAAQP